MSDLSASAMSRTNRMLAALRRRHDQPRNGSSRAWVYAEEVRVGIGFGTPPGEVKDDAIALGREQRIDAFALHTWPSKRWRRIAYEVKATRADLKHELDRPYKATAALALSNEFYLVCDESVNLKGLRLSLEWGLMRFAGGRLRVTQPALWRDTPLPPYSFMLSLARNIQQRCEEGHARSIVDYTQEPAARLFEEDTHAG